jgi:lipopolysaccharide biosynthesis regulator YciM
MNESLALVAVLVALLVGLAVGKAWERYKLRDGRWIDRRRRETPHALIGLNALASGQVDLAIDEFSRAVAIDPDAIETRIVLGNLHREKGQVGRAVQVHQGVLQHPRLTRGEHAQVLLCLGLDFRRGGFVDRALGAFNEVLRLEPTNRYALEHLQKLHEEQQQWAEAYEIRQRLSTLAPDGTADGDRAMLAFLENELGRQALGRGDAAGAAQRFEAAIERDGRAVPAYINLGDVRLADGRRAEAAAIWEQVVKVTPDRAYLVFDRLEAAYGTDGPRRFADLCRRLIAANAQDWRARLALARHQAAAGRPGEALDLLLEALTHNPHALTLHQAIWRTLVDLQLRPELVARYMDLAREAVFYLDPHVCMRCRYRSTELLWQCPQCHEWNTFAEDRIAPAKDEDAP